MFRRTLTWYLWSFPLRKICQNTGFLLPVFSCIRTDYSILSLYGNTRVVKKPCSGIFYATSVCNRIFGDTIDSPLIPHLCRNKINLVTESLFLPNGHMSMGAQTKICWSYIWVSFTESWAAKYVVVKREMINVSLIYFRIYW